MCAPQHTCIGLVGSDNTYAVRFPVIKHDVRAESPFRFNVNAIPLLDWRRSKSLPPLGNILPFSDRSRRYHLAQRGASMSTWQETIRQLTIGFLVLVVAAMVIFASVKGWQEYQRASD